MDALPAPREAPPSRTLKLLSANIQAGSATRRYSDYVTRSWSYALPSEIKRRSLDLIARWHGRGRLRYSLTPRFAPTSTTWCATAR